jgi:hypothetical protein
VLVKVVIATVALGHWYPRGVERMRREFERVSPGYEIQAWVDKLPPGAPGSVVEDGWDYTAYCAKPFALKAALDSGADIAILMDAAFYPIRPIQPLVDHIAKTGYYLCNNGATLGEWCSDRALELQGIDRDEAFQIPEVSSYCVGINARRTKWVREHTWNAKPCLWIIDGWARQATQRGLFEGPHTAGSPLDKSRRNVGFVSNDPRVKGHRHDQSGLSMIAWDELDPLESVDRPRFTAYKGSENETTVLINEGM